MVESPLEVHVLGVTFHVSTSFFHSPLQLPQLPQLPRRAFHSSYIILTQAGTPCPVRFDHLGAASLRKTARQVLPLFRATFCPSSLDSNNMPAAGSDSSSSSDTRSNMGWASSFSRIQSPRSLTSVMVYSNPPGARKKAYSVIRVVLMMRRRWLATLN